MAKTDLTAQQVRDLFHYEPDTGVFTWRVQRPYSKAAPKGARAGDIGTDGYFRVGIARHGAYKLHRLAWLYMTGEWPKHFIDHIDGNPLNNAFSNLRDVPQPFNAQNIRRAKKHSKSGILGVSRNYNRGLPWQARIMYDGRRHATYHATAEEAQAAYLAAKRAHHPGNML